MKVLTHTLLIKGTKYVDSILLQRSKCVYMDCVNKYLYEESVM